MDVILTTNSPGEVSAWLRPMVKTLKEELPGARITVFIPPCTFASGQEVPVVEGFDEVDQVYGPGHYLKYMLLRQNPRGFNPGQKGFVLFLGGDLGHAVFLGKRLKYPVYAYTERDVGHQDKINYFFVPKVGVKERLIDKGVSEKKIKIVGDLMLDAILPTKSPVAIRELMGIREDKMVLNILPGSRGFEVARSLPLFIKSALILKEKIDNFQLIITLAPFISVEKVAEYLSEDGELNWHLDSTGDEKLFILKIDHIKFYIYRGSSYNTMQITNLALALPGTNNVELEALKVPTLVLLPLNWPELIPLPGVIGILGKIPGLGGLLKGKVIPKLLEEKFDFVSPVNRFQGEEIFPELIGKLDPEMIANKANKVIADKLSNIKDRLAEVKEEDSSSKKIISYIEQDTFNNIG